MYKAPVPEAAVIERELAWTEHVEMLGYCLEAQTNAQGVPVIWIIPSEAPDIAWNGETRLSAEPCPHGWFKSKRNDCCCFQALNLEAICYIAKITRTLIDVPL